MTELLLHTPASLLMLALLMGWLLDLALGDPSWLPHPIVLFGRMISWGEHRLNHGQRRKLKGACWALLLVGGVWLVAFLLFRWLSQWPVAYVILGAVTVFFCLAGTTLIREVRMVFEAVDRSLDEGRCQVGRIVGRDTSELSAQEIRTAALETLAENLSDGVIAPLFWFFLLGPAGMLAYKMVNTLDSMVGYRTPRYKDFGCIAARTDDAANYLPARITALLMVIVAGRPALLSFVRRYGPQHASPNSGYPEAALASILDCRFGGPHYYFGQLFPKPYIGSNDRPLTTADMLTAIGVNRRAEVLFVGLLLLSFLLAR